MTHDTAGWRRKLGWPGILLVLGALVAGTALAVHDLGLFELDRNAVDPDPSLAPDDWETLYMNGGSAKSFTGILPDIVTPDFSGTQFQAGGSKDDLDISPAGTTSSYWLWKPGEPLDKDDITNAYAAAYVNNVDTGENDVGDLIIYYGLDRFANNGSAQVGVWFLQDPTVGLTNISEGGGFRFSGAHTDGDVLVQSNFTQGGVIDTVTVYKWTSGALVLVTPAADCVGPPGAPADDLACATVNQGDATSPWAYTPKFGTAGTFPQGSFFEGGINITRLVPEAGCFTRFLAETRTSTPFDSRLKDFVLGSFDLCSIAVDKSGDELSKVGDPADYSITITNTGALTLHKDDISDSLLGDITLDGVDQANAYVTGNGCGATLAPGASCTITLTRTVQAGDPDPLPNTVTVVYRGFANLSGAAISGTDDHSVNLFQPAIAAAKTGDALSKVGDDVDYTITLSNDSSADTPAMNCTANDTLLGVVFSGVLPPGDTVKSLSRTVQAGDPDPLVNTVTLTCSPEGFPNVLEASASHSVNLFQPAIAAAKTGDAYSKVGDDVDYTITLSNNSSADTPAMNCAANDTLLGAVFGGVLPLGDTVINLSRTVQAGDPDPLVNTVTLTCSPEGFPNVLEASASHSVDLLHPSFVVTKECSSPEPVVVGDTAEFTITFTNDGDADLVFQSAECGTVNVAALASETCTQSKLAEAPPSVSNADSGTVTLAPSYGLPNSYSYDASASCVVVLPNQGCTPGFWQGGAGAQLWDQPNDPQWIYNGTNPFVHTTLFNAYFNAGPTDPRLAGLTMYELVGSGGTSDSARRAARDMVAAYLNESAFPSGYPALSLAALEGMWYAAVAGGNAALDAFHVTVGAWNNPPPPGFCPLP